MTQTTELQKVSQEIMRFMRGKYIADEIGDGDDTLRFRRGGKTILTVYLRDNHYDFHVIFGKAEREKFEEKRDELSQKIKDIYDNSTTYHDGKWVLISVADLETVEIVKQLVIIKKKPNRKPFPKTHFRLGNCGHRCDLRVHYTGKTSVSAEVMEHALERIQALYGVDKAEADCDGCCLDKDCVQLNCAREQVLKKCSDCKKHNKCSKQTAGWTPEIHTSTIMADDVTWGILPYVEYQYGN